MCDMCMHNDEEYVGKRTHGYSAMKQKIADQVGLEGSIVPFVVPEMQRLCSESSMHGMCKVRLTQ